MSDDRPVLTYTSPEPETTPTPEQIAAWREKCGEMQERYRAKLAALRPPITGCVDTRPFYSGMWRL